jgi:hypothetical protein
LSVVCTDETGAQLSVVPRWRGTWPAESPSHIELLHFDLTNHARAFVFFAVPERCEDVRFSEDVPLLV